MWVRERDPHSVSSLGQPQSAERESTARSRTDLSLSGGGIIKISSSLEEEAEN